MTLAQLTTLVLSWLDDDQQGYFNPTAMLLWLNNAQQYVQMQLLQAGQNWYMKPVETQTVAGQADYILPVDFMVEHRIEVVLNGYGTPTENRQPLKPITTNQQDNIPIQTGTPQCYYIKKDRITISPIPQQQWTMRLYYSPRVAQMALTTDSPDVPNEYMEYVAILAAFDGFIRDDRAPENLVSKKMAYEEIFKQMMDTRLQDQSRQVVSSGDGESNNTWGFY